MSPQNKAHQKVNANLDSDSTKHGDPVIVPDRNHHANPNAVIHPNFNANDNAGTHRYPDPIAHPNTNSDIDTYLFTGLNTNDKRPPSHTLNRPSRHRRRHPRPPRTASTFWRHRRANMLNSSALLSGVSFPNDFAITQTVVRMQADPATHLSIACRAASMPLSTSTWPVSVRPGGRFGRADDARDASQHDGVRLAAGGRFRPT